MDFLAAFPFCSMQSHFQSMNFDLSPSSSSSSMLPLSSSPSSNALYAHREHKTIFKCIHGANIKRTIIFISHKWPSTCISVHIHTHSHTVYKHSPQYGNWQHQITKQNYRIHGINWMSICTGTSIRESHPPDAYNADNIWQMLKCVSVQCHRTIWLWVFIFMHSCVCALVIFVRFIIRTGIKECLNLNLICTAHSYALHKNAYAQRSRLPWAEKVNLTTGLEVNRRRHNTTHNTKTIATKYSKTLYFYSGVDSCTTLETEIKAILNSVSSCLCNSPSHGEQVKTSLLSIGIANKWIHYTWSSWRVRRNVDVMISDCTIR